MTADFDALVEKAMAILREYGSDLLSDGGHDIYEADYATRIFEAVGLPALLERVEAAEAGAKVWPDDYGWGDLMTLLDEHWPGDIFGDTDTPINALRGGLAEDAGVRIVALLRWVDVLAAKVARGLALADQWDAADGDGYAAGDGPDPFSRTDALRAALTEAER